jgi:hypothetical protein
MPDISMCTGERCIRADECYRCTAKPSQYQTYFGKPPFEVKEGKWGCEYFWKINCPTCGYPPPYHNDPCSVKLGEADRESGVTP